MGKRLYKVTWAALGAATLLVLGATIYPPNTTSSSTIINIVTNSTFQTFITTNIWTNLFATNITVYDSLTITTNLVVKKGTTVQWLVVSNGFSPGFTTLVAPNGPTPQGTNWVLDGFNATVFTIKLTNDFNLIDITNSTPGSSGALVSLNLYPNGADRQITLNSNICLLDTNGWLLLTTMNPGLWWQKLTNATTTAGARKCWISFANNDPTYVQTNTTAIAKFSP